MLHLAARDLTSWLTHKWIDTPPEIVLAVGLCVLVMRAKHQPPDQLVQHHFSLKA